MAEYPEHDKLRALNGANQHVGEFIDWLRSNGYEICRHRTTQDEDEIRALRRERARLNRQDYPRGWEFFGCLLAAMDPDENQFYYPDHRSIERLLADYFQIDMDKIEAEKRTMLDAIRAAR